MRIILINIIRMLYDLALLLLFVSVLTTWLPKVRWHPIGRLVYNLTEPLLQPIRRLIPPIRFRNGVALDLSVIILLVLLEAVYYGLVLTIGAVVPH
ncbi:MAG TPA: YggT family protein [Armatimonadota bacterium]|jgi:YggT family protein